MRLLVTADLHFNHRKSKPLAEELIAQMNQIEADVLLVAGDTSVADGDSLEQCLSLFKFDGPKLFVAGNHELWTRGDDSMRIFTHDLPKRVFDLGWRWLQNEPFVAVDRSIAIVGSVGWYDYSFAVPQLDIPREFYERKVSPDGWARWNDGRFVKLHRTDEVFLDELLIQLQEQLDSLRDAPRVVAAVHHVPFAELLPPRHNAQWDFARAYLGSERIGELLKRYPNVRDVICGHSHFGVEATVGHIRAINIGSGYRSKTYKLLELGSHRMVQAG